MALVIDTEHSFKANKREVPPGLPPGAWWGWVNDLAQTGYVPGTGFVLKDSAEPLDIPWFDTAFEVLPPAYTQRLKAKAIVWRAFTGEWPSDISCWWEIRRGREHGWLPWPNASVATAIDDGGVLHCGHCDARWSEPYPDRCGLCGRKLEEATCQS